ncbi:hypothetical protein WA158_006717 [Blastocystis sp. Blastoise]
MEDTEEQYIATDEEKLSIIQYFVTKCPPGQGKLLINDIQQLPCASLLTTENVSQMFHAYNLATYQVITNSLSDHNLIVSQETDRGNDIIYDPISEKYYLVDHYEQTVKEEAQFQEEKITGPIIEIQKQIQEALNSYIKTSYIGELIGAIVVATSDNEFSIIISGETKKLRSYWSGKWTSHFTGKLENNIIHLEGNVKIHTHFYENGNVQMNDEKVYSSSTFDTQSKEYATTLVNSIKQFESGLQGNLDGMFVCMKTDVIKSLRRLLPRTQMKFQWNVNAHLIVRDLRQ